ncbi:MAG: hypothetical protein Q8L48_25970 [Archangium sp.]|nr:hypothetical protein [Archangium sp.]
MGSAASRPAKKSGTISSKELTALRTDLKRALNEKRSAFVASSAVSTGAIGYGGNPGRPHAFAQSKDTSRSVELKGRSSSETLSMMPAGR